MQFKNSSWAPEKLPIYVGWDAREEEAFNVAAYSIQKHASVPIQIIKLDKAPLIESKVYKRNEEPGQQATDFAYTRFFIPYLQKNKGWALFVDADVLLTTDVKELFDHVNDRYALMCVKHPDYTPKRSLKMDGQTQTSYPRKNWSSVILWNCGHEYNKGLSPANLNKQTGAFLHRFQWVADDFVGELPNTWNYLCDEGWGWGANNLPKLIHYTNGGPWFKDREECVNCELNYVYEQYRDELLGVARSTNFTGFGAIFGDYGTRQKPRLDISEIAVLRKVKKCRVC